MNITVGISDMKISNQPSEILITYSLGSCVGLSLYDPVAGVGGLIHSMLPMSKIDLVKAEREPCMFVDTGFPTLLNAMFELGASKKNMVAKVAGASQIMDEQGLFKIGERNYTLLRKLLWKNNILVSGEDVGGCLPRTMSLHIQNGITTIKKSGQEQEL